MKSDNLRIQQEYERFQLAFSNQLLGFLEIGSRTRGEAVQNSDRDIRIVIQTDEPYLILKEPAWSTSVDMKVSFIEWATLNQTEGLTFGVTNLGYVRQHMQIGRFPLNDHTALFQGQILIDENEVIQNFCHAHAGKFFTNIVDDYLCQLDWRVKRKLPSECDITILTSRLDKQKRAIPMIHTCCRIMRDIAQVHFYQQQQVYVSDFHELTSYYRMHWPDVYPWFCELFSYKIDAEQRKTLFDKIEQQDSEGLKILQEFQNKVTLHWKFFKGSFT